MAAATGVLQLVGTDHAVFNSSQKAAGRHDFRRIPNGVNGIEERMHVVWHTMVATTRLLNASDFVRVTSTQAARTFNLYPRKGLVAAGSDADVIIFDPAQRHVISASRHHSASDVNVYEGMEVMGRVVSTISRGRLAWHDGKLLVGPHTSRFVPTPPGGPLYEGLQEEREAARHSVGPFGSRNVPYGPTPVLRTDDDARLSNQATVSKDEL